MMKDIDNHIMKELSNECEDKVPSPNDLGINQKEIQDSIDHQYKNGEIMFESSKRHDKSIYDK